MSIFVDGSARVLVQGITGRQGQFHTEQMLEDGTKIVGGVTPGKGGQEVQGVPVFNTVEEAVRALDIDKKPTWTIGFVPAAFAKAAAIEALNSGLNTVVITEHVPVHDALAIHKIAVSRELIAIGPNCPGIISPGKTKIGILPANVFQEGPVGLVSRSGTLTYEISSHLSEQNIGQSSAIGIGGDLVNLTSLEEVLLAFEADNATKIIVIIGEIGGSSEENAARRLIGSKIKKPVVSFLAGRSAPKGKTMGHAGAIIEGDTGTVESKERELKAAGVSIATTPEQVAEIVADLLS